MNERTVTPRIAIGKRACCIPPFGGYHRRAVPRFCPPYSTDRSPRSTTAFHLAIASLSLGIWCFGASCDRAPSETEVQTPETTKPDGIARFTVDGAQVFLNELVGTTTRDTAGNPIGWVAQFSRRASTAQTTIESATLSVYVTRYRGDGVYRPDVGLQARLRYEIAARSGR